jgi:1-pyrroline-5-carboxylate dehydrogenase
MEFRPLEGFVFAVSPFNFTSIAGNLPTAPAVMGNVVVWKPSSTAVLSGYYLMKLFKEAGFPDGVINFIPGSGSAVGPVVLNSPLLAGVHFTGSTGVFQDIWKKIGKNISIYRSYPRIVGETGGKNFVFVHSSADIREVCTAIVRGAFEYQGQKCSAASRTYIPRQLWPEIESLLGEMINDITMGDPRDFLHFMNAVIDEHAFDKIMGYIAKARESSAAEIVYGGKGDKSKGYFIEPTVILTRDPHFITMEEEIFGPVITVFLYDETDYQETLHLCDETSPYALTGAIFARDRQAILLASRVLTHAAGNFYINDKPTGAVVGHQPFGGGRASGTNDKAGSHINLHRWTSPRTIKENLNPPVDFKYPFMA